MNTDKKQYTPPEMVSWEHLRSSYENMSMSEKALIGKCFHQHLAGNDFDENMSTPELEEMMHIFKAGWLFHQTFFIIQKNHTRLLK